MNLPSFKENKFQFLQGILYSALLATTIFLIFKQNQTQKYLDSFSSSFSNLSDNLSEDLFRDHLKIQQELQLQANLNTLESEINDLLVLSENEDLIGAREIFNLYSDFSLKVTRNINVSLEADYTDEISGWGQLLLEKNFDSLREKIASANVSLDENYQVYLDSLPPPPVAPENISGYAYTTVSTSRGSFGVSLIKLPLSEVRVITASASDGDCENNCATKPLAQHVSDNGGFAGINGAYFCPPDYSECSGKVNSSDYALYKSSSGKWLNKHALSWGDTGLATFNGTNARFYKRSSDYGGGGVTAGISNYPTLLQGGNIVINEDKLTSYQKTAKGPRGVIGIGKSNLYLAIVNGATVVDAAYAAQAVGMQDALNLDGGGSAAMYINGGYVSGPGRSLPNAVVLTR